MKKSVRAVLFVLSLVIIAALSIALPLVFLGRAPLGLSRVTAATAASSATPTAKASAATATASPAPATASPAPATASPAPAKSTAVSTATTSASPSPTAVPRATTAPPSTPAPASPSAPVGLGAFDDLQATLQGVYGIVNPSVVHIWGKVPPESTEAQVSGGEEILIPPEACNFTDPLPLQSQGSLGSGFVWDKDGHIVTNNHVVKDMERLNVTFADGLTVPAEIVGQDVHTDLAVLRVQVPTELLRPVSIADSTVITPGLFTVSVGNPFGCAGSLSFGVVSAVGRSLPVWDETTTSGFSAREVFADIIQTDTPINPGSSGGVLADLQGRLVGVTFAGMDTTDTGVGFAIPSVVVKRVVPALIENGSYEPPWFGAATRSLRPQLAKAMGLPETQQGALVVDVTVDSPADKAGLRGSGKKTTVEGDELVVGGDIILAVDGQRITRAADLDTYLVRHIQPDQKVQLKVLRDGKEIVLEATMAALPPPKEEGQAGGQAAGGAWLGIDGVTLTAELVKAMDLKAGQRGVLIQSVAAGGPADQAALRGGYKKSQAAGDWVMIGGDVIVKADGEVVEKVEALAEILGKKSPGDTLTLVILREGKETETPVTLGSSPEKTM
jgi:serine protease Do